MVFDDCLTKGAISEALRQNVEIQDGLNSNTGNGRLPSLGPCIRQVLVSGLDYVQQRPKSSEILESGSDVTADLYKSDIRP